MHYLGLPRVVTILALNQLDFLVLRYEASKGRGYGTDTTIHMRIIHRQQHRAILHRALRAAAGTRGCGEFHADLHTLPYFCYFCGMIGYRSLTQPNLTQVRGTPYIYEAS